MDKNNRSVLEILVKNLATERLDQVAFSNDRYIELTKEYHDSESDFELTLTPEQRKMFIKVTDNFNAVSALYARLAYEQGLRDIAELWQELIAKK